MENFYQHLSPLGLFHLFTSLVALITGTYVVLSKKGTKIHKRIGYIYAISMLLVIITAFMIYRLTGKWNIFHWMAVLSSVALIGGMLPMFKKTRTTKDLRQHTEVMGWSVVGLYCAFVSETGARIFTPYAFIIAGVGGGIICTIGSRVIKSAMNKYYPLEVEGK